MNSVTEYGEFDEKFQETYELFKRNIESDEEVGASFAVYKDGKPIKKTTSFSRIVSRLQRACD